MRSERGDARADDITENPKEREGTRLKSDGERDYNEQQNKCVRRPSAWARRAWAVANRLVARERKRRRWARGVTGEADTADSGVSVARGTRLRRAGAGG